MKQEDISVISKQEKRVKSRPTGKAVRFGARKFCGRERKQIREECPAWGKKCLQGGEENHFKAKCRTIEQKLIAKQPTECNQRKIHSVREGNQSDSDDEQCIFSVETINGVEEHPSKLYAEMLLSWYRVYFQLGSGSIVNIIS